MQGESSPSSGLMRVLWALFALLVVALAALLVWQVAGNGDGEDSGEAVEVPGAARIVSVEELREAAAGSAVPIYWIGPRGGTELELSEAGKARVYVRYLTEDAEVGDPRSAFIAIGTYRLPKALAALRANAKRSGTELQPAPRGAFVWVDPGSPTSVYLARPGEDFQVEVYAPEPRVALSVARSQKLRPVPTR